MRNEETTEKTKLSETIIITISEKNKVVINIKKQRKITSFR